MSSARFGFPYIAADQAQKHVTHNAALDMLDATIGGLVASATTTTAPGSPAEGEAYIVPTGATGFGDAVTGDVAVWAGGAWIASAPFFGRRAYALDGGRSYVFAGSFGWREGDVAGLGSGATLGLAIREATLTLTGASVTAAGLIPTRSIVLGVASKTTVAITGASSYNVGDGTDGSRFGGTLGIAAGSSNIGVVGPFAAYSPTNVIVARNGSNFTGGQVRLAALLLLPALAV
jgi:hypothetical protein